jgi:hypothetical protein
MPPPIKAYFISYQSKNEQRISGNIGYCRNVLCGADSVLLVSGPIINQILPPKRLIR